MSEYQSFTQYAYEDPSREIVKRTQIDYYDLAAMQKQIDEVDKRLESLPESKAPPSEDEFQDLWGSTGLSYQQVSEMFEFYNLCASGNGIRSDLEHRKAELAIEISRLKDRADGRSS